MLQDRDLGYILHRAAMTVKCNFTNKLNEIGITPSQFRVLKEIYSHQVKSTDAGLAPGCIAERLEFDRPTVSGILERLESQGWVERQRNSSDRRSCLMCVTEKSIENLNELEEILSVNNSKILKGFTEDEIHAFKSYLLRVIDNFKEP